MFLTKITLSNDITDQRIRDSNLYDLHRTIMSGFPQNPRRVLFRKEDDSVILVSSYDIPKYEVDYFKSVSTLAYNMSYDTGDVLHFKLHANPVKQSNGKCVAITQDEDVLQWLGVMSVKNGFKTLQAIASKASPIISYKCKIKQTHNSVVFNGILKVENQKAFIHSLKNGVGRAKGYGFGLLSVKK